MNFLDELEWRGMLHDITPGVKELMNEKKIVGYIGFDPTAPSMTIGNFLQIQVLKLWQLSGHTPIVLFGGATGRIGDPSGKDKERELKSFEELDGNLAFQKAQVAKFLDFEMGDNKAINVNNFNFYKEMNVLDFLRDVGKTITVSYMMSKDSVQNRLETGLSFTEFSYQLLQGYDFQCLYQKMNCLVQLGGSDQWGNITAGTEFIRRNLGGKAYAITSKLLTKSDGKKFGKSDEGNIWLDRNMTSPYKFYQFFLNIDDADLKKLFRYFSLKSREEIEAIEKEFENDPRQLKKIIAEELTVRVHSSEDLQNIQKVTDLLFGKLDASVLSSFSPEMWTTIGAEIPNGKINAHDVENGIPLVELLHDKINLLPSRSEVRRAVQNNAISINKEKITDLNFVVDKKLFFQNQFMLIENGKKNKFLLELNPN